MRKSKLLFKGNPTMPVLMIEELKARVMKKRSMTPH
jgi:hypothetical protein